MFFSKLDALKLIVFILCANIICSSSLKCFECSAFDKASCEKLQKERECHQDKPVCLTLSYTESLDEGPVSKSFRKKCSTEKYGCGIHCTEFYQNCEAKCCKDNHCNSGLIEKKPLKKRSYSGETPNSASKLTIESVLTLLCTLFFTALTILNVT